MPYDDSMATYTDGELIPTADINKWVNNIDALYNRAGTLLVPPASGDGLTARGAWSGVRFTNAATTVDAVFHFAIPADFLSLTAAKILVIPETSTSNRQVTLASDYGAEGELYNNHTYTNTLSLGSVTINVLSLIDVSAALASAAAGDFVALHITDTAAGGGAFHLLGLQLIYARS